MSKRVRPADAFRAIEHQRKAWLDDEGDRLEACASFDGMICVGSPRQ